MGTDSIEQASREGPSRAETIARYWPQVYSHLAHFVDKAAAAGRCGVSVTYRDDSSFLAVARGTSEDGKPVVCFGSGDTWLGAISGLNRAMGAGAWKPDKYA